MLLQWIVITSYSIHYTKLYDDNISLTGLLGTNYRRTSYYTDFSSTNGGLAVADIYALSNTSSPIDLPVQNFVDMAVLGFFARITSYNVCYTKLLRGTPCRPS